jgi:hypothetical protein
VELLDIVGLATENRRAAWFIDVFFEMLIPSLLQGGIVFIEDYGPSFLIAYSIISAFHALTIAVASDKLLS